MLNERIRSGTGVKWTKTRKIKQGMMQELLTGRIRLLKRDSA